MAKKISRKSKKENIDNYGEGDVLLDLLRDYYKKIGMWESIVANDKNLQSEKKKKKINDARRYK